MLPIAALDVPPARQRGPGLRPNRGPRWEPLHRLRFSWRNATFALAEWTEVDVAFAPQGEGTLVTVRHTGWEALRPDHPARHGMDDVAFARSVGLWWGEQRTALRLHALPPRPAT